MRLRNRWAYGWIYDISAIGRWEYSLQKETLFWVTFGIKIQQILLERLQFQWLFGILQPCLFCLLLLRLFSVQYRADPLWHSIFGVLAIWGLICLDLIFWKAPRRPMMLCLWRDLLLLGIQVILEIFEFVKYALWTRHFPALRNTLRRHYPHLCFSTRPGLNLSFELLRFCLLVYWMPQRRYFLPR